MFFRKCLMTFGLTLLCLPFSLSAQTGWKVVNDRTNSCQISVPENWGQSVFMVRSDGKVRIFDAETQTMVTERMLENTPKLVFYVEIACDAGSATAGHLSGLCGRERISLHRANQCEPDYPEDQVKRIVATFAAAK